MTLPRRPQLAAVLAALTDTSVVVWQSALRDPLVVPYFSPVDVGLFCEQKDGAWVAISDQFESVPLTVTSVKEAWERLETRGLIPHGYAGRFLCPLCVRFHGESRAEWSSCGPCGRTLRTRDPAPPITHPATMPDLVAWLSLGFAPSDDGTHPGILGAEELAASYGHPVAWEVTAPVLGIGGAYRPESVGERLLGAGIATWVSNGHLVLAVPPITDGRER